ncbi:BON domain-containing protein [Chitinophaga silvatica]|uniref:BON domain-containing protein n=1 Tax=Chitinophaga silvatica TaxID=2282649 RepID=A0A3E1YCJ7_9BACT|nr:BON domain-containing protein [Chitinophaga silvatica]RFS24067.1 BON domain-containing protein [Chitinophaga silvatica]
MFPKSTAFILYCYMGMLTLTACQPSDKTLRAQINNRLSMIPGISVTVKDGNVVLQGVVKDEVAKAAAEEALTGLKGIKSYEDKITVYHPPVITPPVPVQIISSADLQIKHTLDSVFQANGYSTVDVLIENGTVTLEGIAPKKQLKKILRITHQYTSGNVINNIKPVNH